MEDLNKILNAKLDEALLAVRKWRKDRDKERIENSIENIVNDIFKLNLDNDSNETKDKIKNLIRKEFYKLIKSVYTKDFD